MGNIFLFESGLHIDVKQKEKKSKKERGKRIKACIENVSKRQILNLINFFLDLSTLAQKSVYDIPTLVIGPDL